MTALHMCPTCKNPYSGEFCIACCGTTIMVEAEVEKSITEQFRHKFVSIFSKKTPGIVDDISVVKKDVYDNMWDYYKNGKKNPLSPTADFRPDSLIRKLEERTREQEKKQEKPTLKVFEITVWRIHPGGVVRGRTDVVVMLSENEDTASTELFDALGYDDKTYTLDVREVTGPFKSGSILSTWTNT